MRTNEAVTRQAAALRPGDLIPHFEMTTIEGRHVRYAEYWQQRNLVLMMLPASLDDVVRDYVSRLTVRLSQLRPHDTTLLVTAQAVEGLPPGSLIITDRWGEVVHIAALPNDITAWPPSDSVIEWVQYLRIQCPECPP